MPRAKIQFFSEKIDFKCPNPRKTAIWLAKICQIEKRPLDSLAYIFCADSFLVNLNIKYLRHPDYTDILSFDYSEDENICGEIYISIPRVHENSKKFNQPFETELRRVLAHGLLHFLGYDDKVPAQKSQMRMKEEACLSLWK